MVSNGVNDVKKHHLSWCLWCQKWGMVSKMVLNDVKKHHFLIKKWCLWFQMMSNMSTNGVYGSQKMVLMVSNGGIKMMSP